MSKIQQSTLSLAAEYAVASELCRKGIYAQLTLGNQKRTDILVLSERGKLARIEVKAKQGTMWPNCKGTSGNGAFLIFVDYYQKSEHEAPDFYVLTAGDWGLVLKKRVKEIRQKDPKKKITITSSNIAAFVDQINRNGKPYQGMSIRPSDVIAYRDKWASVDEFVNG
jgi:hypothetical protein